MSDALSVQLVNRLQQGDPTAADEVFTRYVQRLTALARSRLAAGCQCRVAPEDIVQSVYRSFFRAAGQDRYECGQSGDLWRLLARITVNKTRKKVKFHLAAKRTFRREVSADNDYDDSAGVPAREPTPDEALGLIEEIERVIANAKPLHRQIIEFRLQGLSEGEVALNVGRSERTIRRALGDLQAALEQRLRELAI